MAQLMPLPLIVSRSSKYWFYLLVLAHQGNPGQNPESCKMVVVVVVLHALIDRVCIVHWRRMLLTNHCSSETAGVGDNVVLGPESL